MFVALVPHSAFTGDLNNNPYNFKAYNLNFIAAYIDGEQFPSIAYTPNFANKHYIREFYSLFETLNQLSTESVLDFDREDYPNGNVIYGFNFSPDNSDDCSKSGYVNTIKRGSLGLQLKFAQALTETINVIVYCEFDNMVEIDAPRNAITDYI